MIKFLANENFPASSIRHLQNAGWDVSYIRTECPGISDEAVLTKAIIEERTILTFDSDYGTLIFKYGHRPPKGVIYFRLSSILPELPGTLIEQIINEADFDIEYSLWIIGDHNVRRKRY